MDIHCNRRKVTALRMTTVPASGLELVPEVLELLIPHVVVGKDIDGGVFVDGIFDFGDYFALAL
jgi:hypothetical protein